MSLSRAIERQASVYWATRNITARAGPDYRSGSGRLLFPAGKTSATVAVTILDDAHDEGTETFRLVLGKPVGAYILDNEAIITIENDDPIPGAWLARFGRTVAGQAVDMVGARLAGDGDAHVRIGGVSLHASGGAVEPETPRIPETGLRDLLHPDPLERTGTMSGRELLMGSSFRLGTREEDADRAGMPQWTAWGRFATDAFDADVDSVRMDGEVTSGFLGADVSRGRWLAGAALSLSEGEGSFTLGTSVESAFAGGEVESTLTALYPYARWAATDRLSLWTMAGYGTGELTLVAKARDDRETERYTTGIDMRMGAVGARGEVLSPAHANGISLGVRTGAFWVGTESDPARSTAGGLVAGSDSGASRIRLVVEGSRAFALDSGRTLTPSVEIGVRQDAGDAETGTGLELGGGLRYEGSGFSMAGTMRTLVAHEESGYEEWGASGALRIDPGTAGHGFSLTVTPAVGAESSGVERLWSLRDTGALAPGRDFDPGSRIEAQIGYGIGVPRSRGVVTPWAGFSLADRGIRTWRTGMRWNIAPGALLGLEAARVEGSPDGPVNALRMRAAMRW